MDSGDQELRKILERKTKAQLIDTYILTTNRNRDAYQRLSEKCSVLHDRAKSLETENTRVSLAKAVLQKELQDVKQELNPLRKLVDSTKMQGEKHGGGRPLKAAPGSSIEKDIFLLREAGKSIRKIAKDLNIAPMTVQKVLKSDRTKNN